MFRNSVFFPLSNNRVGKALPANIDYIEVNADKSIIISKRINYPDEEVSLQTYKIENVAHINIALKVLSGVVSVNNGIDQLHDIENSYDTSAAEQFPLGMLLLSLTAQSPDNKKIRFIDPEVERNVKMQVGLENNKPLFKVS